MEKATKAIRRSGVKLRSLSTGHGDLQMVISQLGEVRSTFKAFALAQATAMEDMLRWAGGGGGGGGSENRAIEETFGHLAELSVLWSEVQKDFADQLKEYRSQYELVLEGERHVADAREVLSLREQREGKLRRDLKKASKKAPLEEICMLKEKLGQAERSRDLAHLDVVERVAENEAVKMIRVKEGLMKLGAAYCDMAHKCLVIFTAHQNITVQLPDVTDRDIQGVKYTGAGAATRCVQEAKERLRSFRRSSTSPPKAPAPHPSDPPPPYTPTSATNFFPASAPAPPHPPLTHSPSLPEERTPNAHTPSSAHSTSTPNLTEDTHTHAHAHAHGHAYAHSHAHTDTSSPPPLTFDPDTQTYRHTDCHLRNRSHSCQFTAPPYSDAFTPPPQPPPQQPPSRPPPPTASVRPRVGWNPFFEDSEGEEEGGREGGEGEGVGSLSGALKKTGIR